MRNLEKLGTLTISISKNLFYLTHTGTKLKLKFCLVVPLYSTLKSVETIFNFQILFEISQKFWRSEQYFKKKIINFKNSFQSEVENKNSSAESFKPLYRFEKRDVDAYVPTCQEGNERGHWS